VSGEGSHLRQRLATLALRAGARPRTIAHTRASIVTAAWAPNGRSVAYLTAAGDLYVYRFASRRTVRVKRHLLHADELDGANGVTLTWLAR